MSSLFDKIKTGFIYLNKYSTKDINSWQYVIIYENKYKQINVDINICKATPPQT